MGEDGCAARDNGYIVRYGNEGTEGLLDRRLRKVSLHLGFPARGLGSGSRHTRTSIGIVTRFVFTRFVWRVLARSDGANSDRIEKVRLGRLHRYVDIFCFP